MASIGARERVKGFASLSLEQWAALDEDQSGEWVDGRLVAEEAPSFLHEVVVAWLIAALRAWAVPRGGVVAGSESKLAVGPRRGRKPDVLVYFPGSARPAGDATLLTLPPDLLVEVVSPRPRDGRRDRVEKVAEYAAFGVRFYWIVDPRLRTLEALERGADGRFAVALGATDGVIEPLPALRLDLDALWSEADALGLDRDA